MVTITGLTLTKAQYLSLLNAVEHQVEVCEMFADESPQAEADLADADAVLGAIRYVGLVQGLL